MKEGNEGRMCRGSVSQLLLTSDVVHVIFKKNRATSKVRAEQYKTCSTVTGMRFLLCFHE